MQTVTHLPVRGDVRDGCSLSRYGCVSTGARAPVSRLYSISTPVLKQGQIARGRCSITQIPSTSFDSSTLCEALESHTHPGSINRTCRHRAYDVFLPRSLFYLRSSATSMLQIPVQRLQASSSSCPTRLWHASSPSHSMKL